MSSVFDRFRQPNSMMNVLNSFRSIQNDPRNICDMLLKSGKINEEQYNAMKSMNSPKEMCEYLLNNNADFNKMYNGR